MVESRNFWAPRPDFRASVRAGGFCFHSVLVATSEKLRLAIVKACPSRVCAYRAPPTLGDVEHRYATAIAKNRPSDEQRCA